MGELTVERATEADIADLAALRAEWTAEQHGGAADDVEFEAAFGHWVDAEQHRAFFIARLDGAAIGMVNLLRIDRMPAPGRDPGSWGYLNNMFVRREHRDAGVGAAMLRALLDHARTLELRHVILNPSERATGLYRRHGFRGDTALMAWSAS